MANILGAEETGEALSEGQQLTADELMQAIEDEPRDLRLSTEPPEIGRYLATFSGPVGVSQTPTESRESLLNRIAVFSTTVNLRIQQRKENQYSTS